MPALWMPGAEKLTPSKPGGTPLGDAPPRVVWHTTESPAGDTAFAAVAKYLSTQGTEPHLLWDPTTGRVGQWFPADRSARALKNNGTQKTNRTGRLTIQIEVLGRAASAPLKSGPCKGLPAILAWLDSLDIPRDWPAGYPLGAGRAYGVGNGNRPLDIWKTKGGHYGHSQVPGNSHADPGLIDPAKWIRKVEVSEVPATFPVGESVLINPKPETTVEGGRWVELARIDLPKGGRYLCTLQVRMPAGVEWAEADLARIGWGAQARPGVPDTTGHNPIPPASAVSRWRTPIHHEMAGGGPLAFRVWLPEGSHVIDFVAKATRFV